MLSFFLRGQFRNCMFYLFVTLINNRNTNIPIAMCQPTILMWFKKTTLSHITVNTNAKHDIYLWITLICMSKTYSNSTLTCVLIDCTDMMEFWILHFFMLKPQAHGSSHFQLLLQCMLVVSAGRTLGSQVCCFVLYQLVFAWILFCGIRSYYLAVIKLRKNKST